jgi:TonB family protein
MRRVSLISVLAFLVLIGVFTSPAASAQSKSCSLVLNISAMDENGQAKQIKNARAFVVRRNTRTRIPATLISGSPRFQGLRVGHYRLTILKRGFEKATQEVDFSCSASNSKIEVEVSLDPKLPDISGQSPDSVPPVRREQSTSKIISGGVLNGRAIELPKPAYPSMARVAHASGTVVVEVVIDEKGHVTSAQAISGHPLLKAASVEAALNAKFTPTKLAGQPVKVSGVITYNFVAE